MSSQLNRERHFLYNLATVCIYSVDGCVTPIRDEWIFLERIFNLLDELYRRVGAYNRLKTEKAEYKPILDKGNQY